MAQGRVNREDEEDRHVVFLPKTAAHSKPCGKGHCRGEGTNHRCCTFLVIFPVHYGVIISTPSNNIIDSHLVQEEQIPCAQFR